jgi:hypothetical protein
VAESVWRRLTVDEKTLRFLRLMREQIKDKDTRAVSSGDAATQLEMAPGYPEYESRLADLMQAGYLLPNPNPTLNSYGMHLITDRGIAAADEE